jgi:uncharacterized protein YfaS (alpha-2-macroglobulin family)
VTTYRITAIASAPLGAGGAPARFGEGRATVRVVAPLHLRPATPPHLRPGDQVDAAVLVHNRTGAPAIAELTVAVSGPPGPRPSRSTPARPASP